MLSTHDKKDGWDGPCNRMENDLTNFDPDYEFDRDSFFNNFTKIMGIKYFNSLSLKRINEIEKEFEIFINHKNPSVTVKTTQYMAKKEGGLGMIKINTFWRAIRMSWLRRLNNSKSTWAILHHTETKPFAFNPVTSNMEHLTKAWN